MRPEQWNLQSCLKGTLIQFLTLSRSFPPHFWFRPLNSILALNAVKPQTLTGTLGHCLLQFTASMHWSDSRCGSFSSSAFLWRAADANVTKIGERGLEVFKTHTEESLTASNYRCQTAALEGRSSHPTKACVKAQYGRYERAIVGPASCTEGC